MSEGTSDTPKKRRRRRPRSRRDWRTEADRAAMANADDAPPREPIIDHPLVPAGEPIAVTDDAGLADALDAIRAAGAGAFDTEFIGEETYIPRLCLVQLATTEQVWLVDPLAGVDPTPIWSFIADPDIRTIVHAGQQDLEFVVRELGTMPANVVDAQLAAAFLDLPYPLSLAVLVETFLGVKLRKGMTFTRWDRRPLSPAHQGYAADDVRYLPAAWDVLQAKLAERGRFDDAIEECDAVCLPERFGFDVDRRTERIVGNRSLRPRHIAVVRELLLMRDEAARERNVPPRAFLKDDVLMRMAKELPAETAALERIKGLPWPVIESHGERIVAIVAEVRGRAPEDLPPRVSDEESPKDRVAIDALWSVGQTLARSAGVDPGLVASRRDVARLWFDHQRGRDGRLALDAGWRGRLVGTPLRNLLAGASEVGVKWVDGALRPA